MRAQHPLLVRADDGAQQYGAWADDRALLLGLDHQQRAANPLKKCRDSCRHITSDVQDVRVPGPDDARLHAPRVDERTHSRRKLAIKRRTHREREARDGGACAIETAGRNKIASSLELHAIMRASTFSLSKCGPLSVAL